MRSLTLSSVVLLFNAFLITPGWSLYCWSCPEDGSDNSCSTVQECQYANPQYLSQIRNRFLPNAPPVDYNNPRNVPQPICYTIIAKSGDGQSFTGGRSCSPLGAQMTCEVLRSSKPDMINCTTCAKDFCNDQPIPIGQHMPNMPKPTPNQNRPNKGPAYEVATFPSQEATSNNVPNAGQVTPQVLESTHTTFSQGSQKSSLNSAPNTSVAISLIFVSWLFLTI